LNLPSGDDIPGVVLEDLSEIAEPICDFVEQLKRRGELSYEAIDAIVSSKPSLLRSPRLNKDFD
jgi:hypothetical protein